MSDDRGRMLFTRSGRLHGYTNGTATVRFDGNLLTYDERGMLLQTVRAPDGR